MAPVWKKLMKKIGPWRTHIISWPCPFGVYSACMQTWEKTHTKTGAWSHDMEGHAQTCVERHRELANKEVEQLCKVQVLAWMIINSSRRNRNQLEKCQKYAHKLSWNCLYLARIGRPDILWSVNKLARSVTKWTQACDRRLVRLVSCTHHTNDFRQYCFVWHTAQHCRLGLFQDSDFAGDLEHSKSTSGGVLCIFGNHTFVPMSWVCKKQISVSHSSTESEIISLEELRWAVLRIGE